MRAFLLFLLLFLSQFVHCNVGAIASGVSSFLSSGSILIIGGLLAYATSLNRDLSTINILYYFLLALFCLFILSHVVLEEWAFTTFVTDIYSYIVNWIADTSWASYLFVLFFSCILIFLSYKLIVLCYRRVMSLDTPWERVINMMK